MTPPAIGVLFPVLLGAFIEAKVGWSLGMPISYTACGQAILVKAADRTPIAACFRKSNYCLNSLSENLIVRIEFIFELLFASEAVGDTAILSFLRTPPVIVLGLVGASSKAILILCPDCFGCFGLLFSKDA